MAENSREQIRDEIAAITRQCDALAERTRQAQQHAATLSQELHDLLQRAEAVAERSRKLR
jgi:prefoldin subunit 5